MEWDGRDGNRLIVIVVYINIKTCCLSYSCIPSFDSFQSMHVFCVSGVTWISLHTFSCCFTIKQQLNVCFILISFWNPKRKATKGKQQVKKHGLAATPTAASFHFSCLPGVLSAALWKGTWTEEAVARQTQTETDASTHHKQKWQKNQRRRVKIMEETKRLEILCCFCEDCMLFLRCSPKHMLELAMLRDVLVPWGHVEVCRSAWDGSTCSLHAIHVAVYPATCRKLAVLQRVWHGPHVFEVFQVAPEVLIWSLMSHLLFYVLLIHLRVFDYNRLYFVFVVVFVVAVAVAVVNVVVAVILFRCFEVNSLSIQWLSFFSIFLFWGRSFKYLSISPRANMASAREMFAAEASDAAGSVEECRGTFGLHSCETWPGETAFFLIKVVFFHQTAALLFFLLIVSCFYFFYYFIMCFSQSSWQLFFFNLTKASLKAAVCFRPSFFKG